MTFLPTLDRLLRDATKGPWAHSVTATGNSFYGKIAPEEWFEIEHKKRGPQSTCAAVITGSVRRDTTDLPLICFLVNNAPALAELVRACDEDIGKWLSAALDDPKVCKEMKADINRFFAALAALKGDDDANDLR